MTFREGWNALTDEQRKAIIAMPKFDWEVFAYLMEKNVKMDVEGFKKTLN